MINKPRFPDTMPTVFPHHRPFTMEIWSEQWWSFHGYQVKIHKGRPIADTPKCWVEIGHIDGPWSGYSTMKLYFAGKSKNNEGFRWSQYQDGCFFAFHGRIDILRDKEQFPHELTWRQWQEVLKDPRSTPPEMRKHPHRAADFFGLFKPAQP